MNEKNALHLSFCNAVPSASSPVPSLTIKVQMGKRLCREIRLSCKGAQLSKSGDALLCFGLLPAIELGVDLHIHASVQAELLERCGEIQSLICQWYPGSRPIKIHVAGTEPPSIVARNQRSAVFYSGGVDSSFSLLSEAGQLDGTITLIGADVATDDEFRAQRLDQMSNDVANHFDLQQVVVTTDIRKTMDRLIGWVEYHGAVLAGVGHLLSQDFGKVIIASSADLSSWNRPWGSHPGLDPLWSTPNLEVHHHGLLDRLSKIDSISNSEILLRNLRVCDYEEPNCGGCEDCNFMLHSLETLDARQLAPTFQRGDATKIDLPVTGEGSLSDLTHLREAALQKGNTMLAEKISVSLQKYNAKKLLKRIVNTDDIGNRFKRFKRRRRYRKACKTGLFIEKS